MTEVEFFHSALARLDQKYKEFALSGDLKLTGGYSLCGTPLQQGKPLLMGINWGGAEKELKQDRMPAGDDVPGYHFMKRSEPFLRRYLKIDPVSLEFNYANLCFFRTTDIQGLKTEHFEASLPILKDFVAYIKPPYILSLGNSTLPILQNLAKEAFVIEYSHLVGQHFGHVGKLYDTPFFSVPHPSARVRKIDREGIWKALTFPE